MHCWVFFLWNYQYWSPPYICKYTIENTYVMGFHFADIGMHPRGHLTQKNQLWASNAINVHITFLFIIWPCQEWNKRSTCHNVFLLNKKCIYTCLACCGSSDTLCITGPVCISASAATHRYILTLLTLNTSPRQYIF